MTPASAETLDRLSDPHVISSLDPLGMMRLVCDFPKQCARAAAISAQPRTVRLRRSQFQNVVLTGLGGSAIGADFARALAEEAGTVPVVVNRDYTLPAFTGLSTLVICLSYSGNTEETLAAYAAARAKGATVAAVTSGGELKQRADIDGAICIVVPGGQPPRSATGYMLFPMLSLLEEAGIFTHSLQAQIEEALATLVTERDELGPETPLASNPAKRLAAVLFGRLPVIYGSQSWKGAVAIRWKGQFNENAKEAAFANVLPEQNHNEILAWVCALRQASHWSVVFLRDEHEESLSPRIAKRVEVTRALIEHAARVHEVRSKGSGLLARMLYLAHYADYVTVYLAYMNGVCPTDIASIDTLKRELAAV